MERYKSLVIDDIIAKLGDDAPSRQMLKNHLFMCDTTLRLSYWGYKILKKHYKSYKFETDKSMTCGAFHAIESQITAPYYISEKNIYLFGKKDAFISLLHGNDIKLMLEKASKWAD